MHRLDALETSRLARTAPRDLNVTHAVAEREEHMRREFAAYELHAERCKRHIRRFIATNPDRNCLVYIVPLVTMDAMLRDARKVINHVIDAIQKAGFKAQYLGSSYIFIWWDTEGAGARYVVPDHVGNAERQTIRPIPRRDLASITVDDLGERARRNPHSIIPPVLDLPEATRAAHDERGRIDAEIAARARDAGYAPRVTPLNAIVGGDRHSGGRRRHVFEGVSTYGDAAARVLARTR